MFSQGCFEIAALKTLEKRMQLGSLWMKLYDYSLEPTTRLKMPRLILFCKCWKRKGCSKISKIPKKPSQSYSFFFSVTVQNFRLQQKQTPKKNPCECSTMFEIYQEKVFEGLCSHFIKVTGLQSRIYTLLKSYWIHFFRGFSEKTAVLEVPENFQKNIYRRNSFKQFELSNLPPTIILETDSTEIVSCNCIKLLWRPACAIQKNSTVDVLLEGFQKFLELLFFRNTNGRMLL